MSGVREPGLYADAAQLAAWHRVAAPGHQAIYAHSAVLDHDHPTVALVDRWIAEGSVRPVQRRISIELLGTSLQHCVQRCVSAGAGGEAVRSTVTWSKQAPGAASISAQERVLLDHLSALAEAGLPCPSNAGLADALQWDDRHKVEYRLRKLARAGLVRIDNLGGTGRGHRGRVVTITASGARTAAPVVAA